MDEAAPVLPPARPLVLRTGTCSLARSAGSGDADVAGCFGGVDERAEEGLLLGPLGLSRRRRTHALVYVSTNVLKKTAEAASRRAKGS